MLKKACARESLCSRKPTSLHQDITRKRGAVFVIGLHHGGNARNPRKVEDVFRPETKLLSRFNPAPWCGLECTRSFPDRGRAFRRDQSTMRSKRDQSEPFIGSLGSPEEENRFELGFL
jgi:hypothetical protein